MRKISKIERTIPLLTPRKRVAAYARVSMESERLMHSLSAQVSYYSSLIQRNPEWIYAGVYADSGISGTSTSGRDEFKRMLEDCEAGKIDIILTKSISRFARNTVDLLATVRHLKNLGIEVRFEKEHINSMCGDGELMLSILASFAQEESRSISDNVKWSTRKRFEQGIPNGRVRIFGYRWEDDTLIPVQDEAETVRRIYTEFLDGKIPRTIAKELNEDGITTRTECKWCDFNIRTVLKNITYTGNMLLQKEFVSDPITKKRKKNNGELPRYLVGNTHEAIIGQEFFDKVQTEMKKRGEQRRTVFSEVIKCANCGEYYIRNTVGEGRKVWTCKTKKTKGSKICGSKTIREDRLKETAAKAMGISEFDEEIFSGKISEVLVEGENILHFHFKDGAVITKPWR